MSPSQHPLCYTANPSTLAVHSSFPPRDLDVCRGFVFLTLTLHAADSAGSLPFPLSSLAGHGALHCSASRSPSSEKTVRGPLVGTLER